MRLTPTMLMHSSLRDLNAAYSRLGTTQRQMSSGHRLLQASDDPTTATSAMVMRNTLDRFDVHDRSIADATAWLGTADGALGAALDRLVRVKEIAVRAGNSGGLSDASARTAMAAEVRSIREDLLSLANTTQDGRPVFGGTVAGRAYDSAGNYLGDQGSVMRDVDPNTTVRVNITGPTAFGDPAAAGGDLFSVLDRMATAIAGGDDVALAAAHSDLDARQSTLGSATVEIGARARQMEGVASRAADERLRVKSLLSETEDVDLAQVMVTLKTQENAYEAALQVAAKVLPPSLVDFLR